MKPLRPLELNEQLAKNADWVLLDVRQPEELAICQLPGVLAIPLSELSQRHTELDPDATIVCICHHGIRSAHAAGFLAQLGFENLWNLSGGMDAWANDVDPKMARY